MFIYMSIKLLIRNQSGKTLEFSGANTPSFYNPGHDCHIPYQPFRIKDCQDGFFMAGAKNSAQSLGLIPCAQAGGVKYKIEGENKWIHITFRWDKFSPINWISVGDIDRPEFTYKNGISLNASNYSCWNIVNAYTGDTNANEYYELSIGFDDHTHATLTIKDKQ